MDVVRTYLAVFAQLVPGTTINGYLDESPQAKLTIGHAHGAINMFRGMYYRESPHTAWEFIKRIVDDFFVQHEMPWEVPSSDDTQLLHTALSGILTLTETYKDDQIYVSIVSAVVDSWRNKVDELCKKVEKVQVPLTFSTAGADNTLSDTYKVELPTNDVPHLTTPVIDQMNLSSNAIVALSQAKVETVNLAQQRWLLLSQ